MDSRRKVIGPTTIIVRICQPNGAAIGTGFVVTEEGLIITCAHVVIDTGAGPGDTVRIRYGLGKPHPVHGTSVYLQAIRVVEKAEIDGVDDEEF